MSQESTAPAPFSNVPPQGATAPCALCVRVVAAAPAWCVACQAIICWRCEWRHAWYAARSGEKHRGLGRDGNPNREVKVIRQAEERMRREGVKP